MGPAVGALRMHCRTPQRGAAGPWERGRVTKESSDAESGDVESSAVESSDVESSDVESSVILSQAVLSQV